MIKNKHFSILALFVAASVVIFATSSYADKKGEKALKDAAKSCKQVYPMDIEGCAPAFSRSHGNCLGCHNIQGGTQTGNIAPPLIAMKARFPSRATLRAKIWDITVDNPNSLMPPMGKHKILTEKQIDSVTDFIHSL